MRTFFYQIRRNGGKSEDFFSTIFFVEQLSFRYERGVDDGGESFRF